MFNLLQYYITLIDSYKLFYKEVGKKRTLIDCASPVITMPIGSFLAIFVIGNVQSVTRVHNVRVFL